MVIHCTLFKDWLKTFIRVGKVMFIDVSTKIPLQATPAVPMIGPDHGRGDFFMSFH
ncbi:hypothetical protein ME792_10900 [Lactobacillus delbrueckii]|nr:hypothetical protein ME792_10900 [Lactobacillus delbrueckii]